MVEMPGRGEVIQDEARLRALYERLHVEVPLPEHEPDRYGRAEALFAERMEKQKSRGMVGMYDREDLARAKENAQRLPWAKEMVEKVVRDADFWVGFSDEMLYAMVPTQNPMALTVAQYHGCPIHGGNRSTLEGDLLRPYQWRCNLGGEWWYNGIEVKNPGTGETVRMVDEGPGWAPPEGFPNAGTTYYFMGAYRAYTLYRLFSDPYAPQTGEGHQGRPAAEALALAYVFTGDVKYAHKAGLLLNRLAEVYGRLRGIKEGYEAYDKSKDPIRGYVGEASGREQFFLNRVALVYDLVFEAMGKDEELVRFFEARGEADYDGDGRATVEDIHYNMHRNLFAYAYEFLDRTLPLAGGDFLTSSLYTLLTVGACLENGTMIRQALEAPTGLYNVMGNSFFRDGKFWYDSISYGVGNIRGALDAAEWTLGFSDGMNFEEPMDLYHDPRFRLKEMMAFAREVDCDGRLPMIGDTSGGRKRQLHTPYALVDEVGYLRLPEAREVYGQRILVGTGGDPDAGRKDGELFLLFHVEPWEDGREIIPAQMESVIFHDSGFCVLRAGESQESRRHLVLNYGKGNRGHGHRDKLAVNLMAHGYDFSADLGYPPSWVAPKISGWETHTVSHFTVMVDGENQEFATGSLHTFVPGPWVRLADASATPAYPGRATEYRRAVALIPVDDERSYMVDLFRVVGGETHDYNFHSLAGEEAERFELKLPDGVERIVQEGGTLAGAEVGVGEAPG
ncbi:MAG: heparinase II/III family protein, partial [bacterium]|nr:heparinase II/III family protein [bacterium]